MAFASSTALATNQNYNCYTAGNTYPCFAAYSTNNYLTNDYAINYTHYGVCGYTIQWNGGNPKVWKQMCTSSYYVWACNGNEYQIYGYGETNDSQGRYGNLAGTIDNYNYCG